MAGDALWFDDPMQRPRFTGLATFLRLPWVEDFFHDPPDIGICGVPYDGGVTNRPGPRHAPREVRNQSSLIRRINQATGASPFETARVADIGAAWVEKPFELEGAHSEIQGEIDSLDPAFAPGTGTPEAGGLTMREAQSMIPRLYRLDVAGADMVEVSPPFDVGGIAALNGATVMFELLCGMTARGRPAPG